MTSLSDLTLLDSGLPGPRVAIFGGIHGDEPCGVHAVDRLRRECRPIRGSVLLAYGNPAAIARSVRDTGSNLNRLFLPDELLSREARDSYEYARSRELMAMLDDREALLDLHSSPTAGSPAFIIAEREAWDIASCLPPDIRVSGFARVEAGGTDGYMHATDRIGICVECGQHGSDAAGEVAYESAIGFLAYYGLVEAPIGRVRRQSSYHAEYAYLTRTDDFRIDRPFADFDSVASGELVWYDGVAPVRTEMDGHILFARNRDRVGVEGFVLISEVPS